MIWAVTVIVLPQVGSVGVTARVVPTRFAGSALGSGRRSVVGRTEVFVVVVIALGDRVTRVDDRGDVERAPDAAHVGDRRRGEMTEVS